MAAGDFSASALLNIKLKAEQMWTNSQLAASLRANAEAAIAVLQNQTATFTELKDSNKERTVAINWVNPCAVVDEACESNCDLSEPELETDVKEYVLDTCRKSGFSVDRRKLRTNSYERDEIVAKGLAAAVKTLDEYWAKQVLTKLKAFAGINVSPDPYTFNPATTTTEIPTADYSLDIMANLIYQAQMNRLASPYFINNGTLSVEWINAQLNSGNLDGKGDEARIKALKWYFDPYNFAAAGLTEDIFAVAAGAVAMVTKTENPDTPLEMGGSVNHTLYTIQSGVLPGVKYDVFYTLKCQTIGGVAHYLDVFRVQTLGGIFLNPEGCPVTVDAVEYTPTGVISYTEV